MALTMGVLALGGAVAVVALVRERSAATQRDQRAANIAAVALGESIGGSVGALRGLDGLAADGDVSADEFAAYADDVLRVTPFLGLAFARPVVDADRADFERDSGLAMMDTDGKGGFVPAPSRPEHVVVVDVRPADNPLLARLRGFDIVSDPVRDEARRRSAEADGPVLSAPITLAGSARTGVFVTNRVLARDRRIVGYVSSGVNVEDLQAVARLQLPAGARLQLFDGEQALTGEPAPGGRRASVEAPGRSWSVIVDDPDNAHDAPAVVIATAAVLLAGGVWWSLRRDRRFNEARERVAARNQLVAALGGQLAAASDLAAIAGAFNAGAGAIVDAVATDVAWLEPGSSTVRVFHGPQTGPGGDGVGPAVEGAISPAGTGQTAVPLDAGLPLVDCVVNGRPLVLSRLDHAQLYPDLFDEVRASGVDTVACWPLQGFSRPVLGAVRFEWDRPSTISADTRAAISTLTQLLARTLERASLTEMEQRRSQALSGLAQALAGAISREAIGAAVVEHLPGVVNAHRARLLVVDESGVALHPVSEAGGDSAAGSSGLAEPVLITPGSTPAADAFITGRAVTYGDLARYLSDYPHLADELAGVDGRATALLPLRQGDGRALGVLSIAWPAPTTFEPTLRATLAVVADLVAQAFQRAALHDTEHSLVADLQNRLLVPVPAAAGLQHAASYEPATRAIGMGGDWYDGIVLPDGSLVLVIGDVTGHGATAVAAMAQLQTLIAGLVRVGTPLGAVLATANSMLNPDGARERVYATAQLLHLDVARGVLGHLNAGHPPALLRGPDGGVEVLDAALQPPIGTHLEPGSLEYVPFPSGSLVLAYTDGLIERRSEPITTSIERLAGSLDRVDGTNALPQVLAAVVSDARSASPDANDDDYAAIIVRRSP